MLTVAMVLSLAACAGAQFLEIFGISLSAFQVAGGLVLVWMGFQMLRGNSLPTPPGESDESIENEGFKTAEPSLTPLILFAASPGTITGVITLAVSHSRHYLPVTALVAVVVALGVTWLIMILMPRKGDQKKPGLMHDITTRFMGLIVLAMGVQFGLTGITEFFHFQ